MAQTTPDPSINQCIHFSYLGVHGRLVRKHVPESDPGWIPAPAGDTNHRRPNNHSPGSQEKCSAGAGPLPAGSGGRPLSLRPPLRHSGEGRNPGEGWAAGAIFHTLVCRPQPAWVIPMETCLGSINEPLIVIFIYDNIISDNKVYIFRVILI